MSATPRSTRNVPAEESVKTFEYIVNAANLYKKGVECVAELQNKTVECAVQQGKETVDLWKQTMEKLPWAPNVNPFEGLAGTLDRFADAQKAVIGIAVEQTRAYVELVKERTAHTNKLADAMSEFAQQSFERSVTAQKRVAEATVAEAKSVLDNARERFVVPGGEAVAESIRKGVESVIDIQKDLVEAATKRWIPVEEPVAS